MLHAAALSQCPLFTSAEPAPSVHAARRERIRGDKRSAL
jgi:hypothetical protein